MRFKDKNISKSNYFMSKIYQIYYKNRLLRTTRGIRTDFLGYPGRFHNIFVLLMSGCNKKESTMWIHNELCDHAPFRSADIIRCGNFAGGIYGSGHCSPHNILHSFRFLGLLHGYYISLHEQRFAYFYICLFLSFLRGYS